MTIKQYQGVKLAMVVILAVFFSQAIYFKNYFIPIAVLVASSLILMYLRRQVKDVLADERDYATGGKAALLAIQIYSWTAVCAMFVMYGLRDYNPAYEPIAVTLAFSTCVLMLAYGVIFRYYNKVKLAGKKSVYIILAAILFSFLAVAALRLFSGEDNWICNNGEWVKHGQPDFPAPAADCE